MKSIVLLVLTVLVCSGCASRPSTAPAPLALTTTEPAAGSKPVEPPKQIEPSEEFRRFVENLKIAGLFFSDSTVRITVNGQVFRAGEVIDSTLGVTLVSYRQNAKVLVFADKTGASVFRNYP